MCRDVVNWRNIISVFWDIIGDEVRFCNLIILEKLATLSHAELNL
jgi:hypothetical protein